MPTPTPPISDRALRTLAENRIREAMDEGLFDDLEGAGRPLPDLDEPYDPNWWIRKWMRRERFREELKEGLRELRSSPDESPPRQVQSG